MIESLFDCHVRQKGAIAVIDLSGEVDSRVEARLSEAFGKALASGTGGILINFSQVNYMNSSCIAMLIRLLIRVKNTSTNIAAYGLDKHYVNLLRITRLTDFLPIFADEGSALAELSQKS